MLVYEVWVHHGKEVLENEPVAEDVVTDEDIMDEMLNCYKELLKLFSDVLPANQKLPRDMYQSKKLLSGVGMDYEKIVVYQDNCMLFWKEHINEKSA
jgi:hypothetical protein